MSEELSENAPATRLLMLITQHLQAVPVPPSERAELPIPAALEQLVLACLAKKPEDRPQAARALAQSLDAIEGMKWGEEEPCETGRRPSLGKRPPGRLGRTREP